MTQRLVWPADLQRQEDGSILVSFPDIPEALTEGATEAEALEEAQDCVVAALGGYVEGRHPIPAPSPVRGRPSVALPVLVAAKIVLYGAMHEQGVSNTALAERLGLSEDAVRRLIDLDHRSHIGQVETALHALGPAPDGCHASGVVGGTTDRRLTSHGRGTACQVDILSVIGRLGSTRQSGTMGTCQQS